MIIPIKPNPMGYDTTDGGVAYKQNGYFLFRGSYCVQSGTEISGYTLSSGSRRTSRMEMYGSAAAEDVTVIGGALYVSGGVAENVEVYGRGGAWVYGSGTVSNLRAESSCAISASSGGTIIGIDLYQQSASVHAYDHATLASINLGAAMCSVSAMDCIIHDVNLESKTFAYANSGTMYNVSCSKAEAQIVGLSATVSNISATSCTVSCNACTVGNVHLGSDCRFSMVNGIDASDVILDGGALYVNIQGAYDYRLDGSTPYGSMSIANNVISGGVYGSLTVSNQGTLSDIVVNVSGVVVVNNRTVINGITFPSSGSAVGSAYVDIGAVRLTAGAVNVTVNARSTVSNIRKDGDGNATLTVAGDGKMQDISGAFTATLNGSSGAVICDVSLASCSLTQNGYGSVSNVVIDRGGALLGMYCTASDIHIGSGVLTIQGANVTNATVSSGVVVYTGSMVYDIGTLTGNGSSCFLTANSATLQSGTISNWGYCTVSRGGALVSVTLDNVKVSVVSSASLDTVLVSTTEAQTTSLNWQMAYGSLNSVTVTGYPLYLYQNKDTGAVANLTYDASNYAFTYSNGKATNVAINCSSALLSSCIGTGYALHGGAMLLYNCGITSATVDDGCSARVMYGANSVFEVSSGGVLEAMSSASIMSVHVLSGGSLNCINNAHVYQCTSEAGAIVTGSNIEIIN